MLNIASRSSALAVGQSVSARIYGLVPLPIRLKLFPCSCSNASKGRFNYYRVEGVVGIHRVSPYTIPRFPRLASITIPLTQAPWKFAAHMLMTLVTHASEAIVK